MATIKQMAMNSYLERIGESQSISQEHGLGYMLGYRDCAKGLLEAMKMLIDEGYSVESIKYYVEKKLSEFNESSDNTETECLNVEVEYGGLNREQQS